MTEIIEQTITLQYVVKPSEKQLEQLSSHIGAVRYAYNYGLNKILTNWENVKNGTETEYINTHHYSMKKLFNQEKDEIAPWWKENSKEAYNTGFMNLHNALQRFYKKKSKLPKYKTRHLSNDLGVIFSTNTRRLEEDRKHFTVPTIGKLELSENPKKLAYLLRHNGRIANVTIKHSRNRWNLTINVKVSKELWKQYHLLRTKKDKKKIIGVDVGIKSAAVFSDGTVIENIKSYEKQLKKLRRLNKQLSRRRKFDKKTGEMPSKRYEQTKQQLRKTYAKVSNQELDFAHKLSKKLVDEFEVIGLEDLNVAGMMKNRKLSRRIAHASFGRLRLFTQYKSEWYGSKVVLVDRFYPSSKTCSSCGVVRAKLSLKERTFKCDNTDCGFVLDRDLNAAVNIEKEAAQSCGEAINGQGDESDGLVDVLSSETGSLRTDKLNKEEILI